MHRKQALTAAFTLVVAAAAVGLYLSRLITEDQCGRLNGAIDFEARVCIIRGVAHPLREAAIRFLAFWGVVVILVSGAIYGASRMIVASRRHGTSDGAA